MLTYDLNGENVTAKGSNYLTEDKIEQNHETSSESESKEDSEEEEEPTTEYTTTRKSTTRKSTTKHTTANSPIQTTSGEENQGISKISSISLQDLFKNKPLQDRAWLRLLLP